MDQEKLKDLIQKSIQGDREAQETLVLAVQNKVYYHCKKMLKKEEAAQDAAQDVLIVMLTSLNKLKEPAAFWGWINGITANRCRHLLSAPHKGGRFRKMRRAVPCWTAWRTWTRPWCLRRLWTTRRPGG